MRQAVLPTGLHRCQGKAGSFVVQLPREELLPLRVTFQTFYDPLPNDSSLFRTYTHAFSEASSFFEYDPHDPNSFRRRADRLHAQFRGDRSAISKALVRANENYGAAAAALENARALGDAGTLAVVTGQQTGLFGGPLYTLYKAITTIRLAQDLTDQLGRRVVPVFWMASEDHDFDEVRRAVLLDRRGRLRRLDLPKIDTERVSVGQLPVPRRIQSLLREMTAALDSRCRFAEFERTALQTAALSSSWAEWFGRQVAAWLSNYGLVVLDPMLPELRVAVKDFMPIALLRREGIHRELTTAAIRLERRGFRPGLAIEPEHANFFFYHRGQRRGMFWDNGFLVDRAGQVKLSVAEATALMNSEPTLFSPNVVLRPLVQDLLLPTVGFVVGPGELAYLAQMREVYRLFGLEMPVVVPRLSATLIAPEVGECLRRLELGVGDFLSPDLNTVQHKKLAELDTVGIDANINQLVEKVDSAYADALAKLTEISPQLLAIGEANRLRVRRQIDYLRAKAHQHHRRVHRQVTSDLRYAANAILPGGALQERTISVLPALLEYGPQLIRWLLRIQPNAGHQLAIITSEKSSDAAVSSVARA